MSVVLLMHKDTYKSARNEKNGSVEELSGSNPLLLFYGKLPTSQTGFHEARGSSSLFASKDELVITHDRRGLALRVLLRRGQNCDDLIAVCSVFGVFNVFGAHERKTPR